MLTFIIVCILLIIAAGMLASGLGVILGIGAGIHEDIKRRRARK